MKPHHLLLLLLPWFLNSCVSGMLYQLGKTPVTAKSREEAVEAYGAPVKAGPLEKGDPVQKTIGYLSAKHPNGATGYEIYTYRGPMQDSQMSWSAMECGACTLGIADAAMLPFAVLGRLHDLGGLHLYLAAYDGPDKLVLFRDASDDEEVRALLKGPRADRTARPPTPTAHR